MQVEDGRNIGAVFRENWALVAHTTHQKVSFRHADEDERRECLTAFQKEIDMFNNYGVVTPVQKSKLP